MSSISSKISLISKDPTKATIDNLVDIEQYIDKNQISGEEMGNLCKAVIKLFKSKETRIIKENLQICRQILLQDVPKSFVNDVFDSLEPLLGHKKSQIRDLASEIAQLLIEEITPEVFWQKSAESFDKTEYYKLKGSYIVLYKYTLERYPEANLSSCYDAVFKLIQDQVEPIKIIAREIVLMLNETDPKLVNNKIKKIFPNEMEQILVEMGLKEPSKPLLNSDIVIQQFTQDEIELSLLNEFDDPFPEIEPNSTLLQFNKLLPQLNRKADWEVRVKAIKKLIAHARGTDNQSAFAREIRTIQDGYIECLTDARSAVSKCACLSLSALAQCLTRHMDACSEFLFSPLLQRTSHGTAVIAISAELSIIKFVSFVYGKKTKRQLEFHSESKANSARVTICKAIQVALVKWPSELTEGFDEIIDKLKHDPSDKVRFVARNCVEEEEEEKPEKVEEEVQVSPSLEGIIDSNDTKEVNDFIIKEKPNLMGYMKQIVDLIIIDMNEESELENAYNLLNTLCTDDKYYKLLYSYLSDLIRDITYDEKYGLKIVQSLSSAFGDFPIARFLMGSTQKYVNDHILALAERAPTEIEFCSRAVINAILNKYYDQFRARIMLIVKRIFDNDHTKCEILLASLPPHDRNEILKDIKEQIPQLYSSFEEDANTALSNQLVLEIEKAKSGQPIDQDLLLHAIEGNISCLVLAIAAIRETHCYVPFYIPYLTRCMSHPDHAIVGASILAFNNTCVSDPNCCRAIADCFDPINPVFKALANSMPYASKEDVQYALDSIKSDLTNAISDIKTKYAALTVLASACKILGDEFKSYCGQLSLINSKILESLIQ